MTKADARSIVYSEVQAIRPFDELERQQRSSVLGWIESGAPLYRLQKPDVPPKHLVSYFVAIDEGANKVLLVDHKKAGLWLPTGGHVEVDEDPAVTVEREAAEELGIDARFHPKFGRTPIFLSETVTVGLTAGHTDVSLWYVISQDARLSLIWDREEFNSVRWFGLEQILALDQAVLDPCMKRFTLKLLQLLV